MIEPKTKRRIYVMAYRLRKVRAALNETQEMAAREFGVSRIAYMRWEKEGMSGNNPGYALEGIRLIMERRNARVRMKRHYYRHNPKGSRRRRFV